MDLNTLVFLMYLLLYGVSLSQMLKVSFSAMKH